ncbi:GNAT family N-acetyltransferase [Sphingomonas sp. MMSM20]|uniref:GNAT family N-acetyltransferase n=1 Tax=Sphingomonas lycopersici TaxID=2951807 RepID=UPI0022374DDD|nr:GNAT family N-acetyltransferase [Sphingomonas lycopersici]
MTDPAALDPALFAWLAARSIARGVPLPVASHGGYRVDTRSDTETARWVFAHAGPGLESLARAIHAPRHFLKLCATPDVLHAALPPGWQIHPPGYFMIANAAPPNQTPAPGYEIAIERRGAVTQVRITAADGTPAASGYAAETAEAFIYDRIETAPAHRRRGLGGAVMAALHRAKRRQETPELLVATEEGRALYTTLGWRVLSPYSTASIPAT